ncbi:peptide/nickel transport system permease protein [Paracoccus saliphilus]|nr:peptide/nickel transport system permease protein [Paracoccus saliphilus]
MDTMTTLLLPFGWAIVALACAAVVGWSCRAALVLVLPARNARTVRHAPLTATFGMAVIAAYVIVVLAAPLIAPHGERIVLDAEYLPWNSTYPLGTDNLGRDMLSRLIFGIRNSVGIAFATTVLAFLAGAIGGLLAATIGGWLDQLLSRIVDVLMAIPSLIFALLMLSILGTSIPNLILVIAIVDATRVFRIARAVAANIVVMEYVESARLRGAGLWRLIGREILPNAMPPLVAEFGLRFCFVFLSISALSFLGLGVQPPSADLGAMVRENASLITFGDITPILPAALIALLTVAVNFVVDWALHLSSGLKE